MSTLNKRVLVMFNNKIRQNKRKKKSIRFKSVSSSWCLRWRKDERLLQSVKHLFFFCSRFTRHKMIITRFLVFYSCFMLFYLWVSFFFLEMKCLLDLDMRHSCWVTFYLLNNLNNLHVLFLEEFQEEKGDQPFFLF